ncbi:MAG: OsmC family protein [Bacteroidetes bacterium]|nr:OsmC family protein [Bacteroidota bacterium]
MKITLKRQDDAFHLLATNELGKEVHIDAGPALGGHNLGARPMELLIMGLGGCSSIDVISILKKFRQNLEDIQVTIDAEREAGVEPSLFTTIHAHYSLTGNLDKDKVERALALSIDKYCSVARVLEKTAKITYTYEILPGVSK